MNQLELKQDIAIFLERLPYLTDKQIKKLTRIIESTVCKAEISATMSVTKLEMSTKKWIQTDLEDLIETIKKEKNETTN